ncbi:MAG: hypothetical protein AB1726_07905 [Planctomycetota bacterium]
MAKTASFFAAVCLGLLGGSAIAQGRGIASPTGDEPRPKVLDCSWVNQWCGQPTVDCTNMGGYCQVGKNGGRLHDPDDNGCGCMI